MTGNDGITRTSYLEWATGGHPAIWRYVVAIVIAFLLWVLGGVPAAILFPQAVTDPMLKGVFLPWSFVVGFVIILLVTRILMGRPGYSLFSAGNPIRWGDYLVGVAMGYVVSSTLLVLDLPFSVATYQGFGKEAELGGWLVLFTLLGFVVQTGFEELFFRGLIMQFLWRIKPWLPLVVAIQAVLFALPHFGNVASMSSMGYISVAPYVIIAAAWGWVAWRTGSLLTSMGLHFANNSFAVFAIGTKGDILVPYAPILEEMPSFSHLLIGTCAQLALTVVAVELWMRWREKAASKAAA